MIPVLQVPQRRTLGQKFSDAAGAGLQALNQYEQQDRLSGEQDAARSFLQQITGQEIPENLSPEYTKMALDYALSQQNEQQKAKQSFDFDAGGQEAIEKQFGKQFADVWKATPTGGRTELIRKALDVAERGENVQDLLSQIELPEEAERVPEKVPQFKKGKAPDTSSWPDFNKRPKGFSRKEWTDEKKTWRKENAPIFEANRTKLENTKADVLATKKLSQLNTSGKLPQGMERLIINPETGEPYGVAQLAGTTPEVQEWVKTIARFQNRAKDSFGSRVTNFDLVSYMKQFPNLLNTTEGRQRILEMMDLNYEMDQIYDNALDEIYKHYGLGNVPQEMADELARKMVEDQTEKLRREYLGLDAVNKEETEDRQRAPSQGNRPSLDEIFG